MKIEDAQRRIAAFANAKRFGRSHLYLAYHAALPLALTPDLLYCIWGNFTRDIHQQPLEIPWIAVSDLILSSLCNEVGYELYEMDATVRQELLKQFKDDPHFTEKRLKQVAEFLLAYVRRDLNHPDAYYRDFAESQTWAGLAYIEPTESVKLLVAAFEQAYRENPADLMRLVSLTEMLYQPIPEFEKLLIFARAMGHYRRKRLEEAKGEVMKLTIKDGRLNIGNNIVMTMPPELLQLIAPPVDAEMQKQIDRLIKVIETAENESTRRQAIESLEKIGKGNPQAIAALVKVIVTTESAYTRWRTAESLGKIGQGNPQAIAGLLQIIETTKSEYTRLWAAESLGKIDPGNPQAIGGLLQVIATNEDEYTRRRAAESLGKIDPSNPQAIAGLLQVTANTENEKTRLQAIESLGKIGQGNPQAIAGLLQIIETTKDEDARRRAAESLGKIGQGNPQAIAGLVQVIANTKSEYTRRRALEILKKLESGNNQE